MEKNDQKDQKFSNKIIHTMPFHTGTFKLYYLTGQSIVRIFEKMKKQSEGSKVFK